MGHPQTSGDTSSGKTWSLLVRPGPGHEHKQQDFYGSSTNWILLEGKYSWAVRSVQKACADFYQAEVAASEEKSNQQLRNSKIHICEILTTYFIFSKVVVYIFSILIYISRHISEGIPTRQSFISEVSLEAEGKQAGVSEKHKILT